MLDQVFGAGMEVVKDVLFVEEGAGVAPGGAVLSAAPEVGDGDGSPRREGEHDTGQGEGGRERDVEAAVAVEEGDLGAVTRHRGWVEDEHGDPGAVFGGHKLLGSREVVGIEASDLLRGGGGETEGGGGGG